LHTNITRRSTHKHTHTHTQTYTGLHTNTHAVLHTNTTQVYTQTPRRSTHKHTQVYTQSHTGLHTNTHRSTYKHTQVYIQTRHAHPHTNTIRRIYIFYQQCVGFNGRIRYFGYCIGKINRSKFTFGALPCYCFLTLHVRGQQTSE